MQPPKYIYAKRARLKALINHLRALQKPIVLAPQIAAAFFQALDDLDDELPSTQSIKTAYQNHLRMLVEFGALTPLRIRGLKDAYQLGIADSTDTNELYCLIDPFSYISHLSAMAWHGLTDRLPKTLFISRPDRNNWKTLAYHTIEKDVGSHLFDLYLKEGFPVYTYPNINKLRRKPINIYSTKRLAHAFHTAYLRPKGTHIRVATIGRTFLDMVADPSSCGGIFHVLETFEDNGAIYSDLIIEEIGRHGRKIEQARAGYLLEEYAKVTDPRLDEWRHYQGRGGSRKLDPSSDFSSSHSERWNISINI